MKRTKKTRKTLLPVDSDLFFEFGGRLPNSVEREWKPSYNPTSILDENGQWYFKNGGPARHYSPNCKMYWKPGNHSISVKSYAEIDSKNSRVATCYYHNEWRYWTVPVGFKWDIDENGLRIVRRDGADYHPTTFELLHKDCILKSLKKLEINASVRLKELVEIKKNKEALKKCEKSLKVVFVDSLDAGNCYSGTVQFCNRHGLNKNKAYSPRQLMKLCNGDAQRVRLAINAALRRHKRFVDNGAEVFYP